MTLSCLQIKDLQQLVTSGELFLKDKHSMVALKEHILKLARKKADLLGEEVPEKVAIAIKGVQIELDQDIEGVVRLLRTHEALLAALAIAVPDIDFLAETRPTKKA